MRKKKHPPIVDHFMAQLLPHGPITVRAMFGGFGIFYDGVVFAILVANELYFRVDEESRTDFESRDCKQFTYDGKERPVCMPYFTVPDSVLKSPRELKIWIERAYMTSLSAKKPVKKKIRL